MTSCWGTVDCAIWACHHLSSVNISAYLVIKIEVLLISYLSGKRVEGRITASAFNGIETCRYPPLHTDPWMIPGKLLCWLWSPVCHHTPQIPRLIVFCGLWVRAWSSSNKCRYCADRKWSRSDFMHTSAGSAPSPCHTCFPFQSCMRIWKHYMQRSGCTSH